MSRDAGIYGGFVIIGELGDLISVACFAEMRTRGVAFVVAAKA